MLKFTLIINTLPLQRQFFLIISLFLYCTLPAQTNANAQRFQFTQPKMGSPFHLIFYAQDTATASRISAQSFALIDSLNELFSDYLPNSALNKLCNTAGSNAFVAVPPALYYLIIQSKNAWQSSWGAFDITTGKINKIWRQARKEGLFPTAAVIKNALATKGFEKVKIDTVEKTIKLLQPGMQLDLGGIAKGYVAQEVIQFLGKNGIHSALADAGGDIVCSGAPPGKKGWSIGINMPQSTSLLNSTIDLKQAAVATSGEVYQYMEHNGKKYAHIINPQTGYGVTFQRNVTVIAAEGATADWLATACSILPIAKAKKLAHQYNAQLIITQMKRKKLKITYTRGAMQYLNVN